ncbi:hypothetical protein [Moritella marina]|nr:hypothetical protein [Moritella marina]
MPHNQSSTTASLLLTSVFARFGISLVIIVMLWTVLPYLVG